MSKTPALFMQICRVYLQAIALVAACAGLLSAGTVYGATDPTAPAKPPRTYTATAIYSTAPELHYAITGEPNKLSAAAMAQRACLAANPRQSADAYCELVRADGAPVTTATQLRAGVPPKPHPLYLWRLQNEQATVYLAGSVHILKAGLYPLAEQYEQAFERSDQLVLEVDLSAYTPEQMQFKTLQYAMLEAPATVRELLDPATYAALAALGREYGMELAQLDGFKPAFITQQLAVLSLMALGYDPNAGLEKYFTERRGERAILQLEDLDFQLSLLMNQPAEVQRAMVTDTLQQMPDIEPLMAELVRAWLAGDDASFVKAFTAQAGASAASREFMRQLMDERNVGMAEKIAGYLQGEGQYFVLIGAGHYVGDNNVIELLQKRGLQSTRIYSNDTLTP